MKVDLICTADMHLHWKTPAGRKDKFIDAQWRKVKFIADLQKKYDCAVANAGDTLDTWKSDKDSLMLEMISMASDHLPTPFYTIYGQHEMPSHSMENTSRSPLNLLSKTRAGTIIIIPNGGYERYRGYKIYGAGYGYNKKINGNPNTILLTHQMVWKGEEPYPGAPPEGNVDRVMESYPGHRLIVSGDNHVDFFRRSGYRTLINPGSMMRRTKAQKWWKPSVVLWNKSGDVQRVRIPVEKDVFHDDVNVEVGGKVFAVLETISKASKVKDTFEANVADQMEGLPHPTRLKVKKLMKETE
jgi:hypothetical protein